MHDHTIDPFGFECIDDHRLAGRYASAMTGIFKRMHESSPIACRLRRSIDQYNETLAGRLSIRCTMGCRDCHVESIDPAMGLYSAKAGAMMGSCFWVRDPPVQSGPKWCEIANCRKTSTDTACRCDDLVVSCDASWPVAGRLGLATFRTRWQAGDLVGIWRLRAHQESTERSERSTGLRSPVRHGGGASRADITSHNCASVGINGAADCRMS